MRCEACGGEVNISVGRCTVCGKPIDETTSIRIERNLDAIAEQYGVEEQEDTSDLPSLLATGTYRRKKGADEPVRKVERQYNGPSLGLSTYLELLGEDGAGDAESKPAEPSGGDSLPAEGVAAVAPTKDVQAVVDSSDEDETVAAKPADEPSALERFITRDSTGVLSTAYKKVDKVITPPIEKVLDIYHKNFPEMNRVQSSRTIEKLAVLGVFIVSLAAVITIILLISSAVAPSVKGEWLVSETSQGETLTMEFTGSRKVIVRTYIDGEEHIYQRGEYKKSRKNGNNLLVITYEDGTTSRLYYDIARDVGTFTNVDSSQTAVYRRL